MDLRVRELAKVHFFLSRFLCIIAANSCLTSFCERVKLIRPVRGRSWRNPSVNETGKGASTFFQPPVYYFVYSDLFLSKIIFQPFCWIQIFFQLVNGFSLNFKYYKMSLEKTDTFYRKTGRWHLASCQLPFVPHMISSPC